MKLISLPSGHSVKIDDDDFNELKQYNWFFKRGVRTLYAIRHIWLGHGKMKTISMHRQIMHVFDSNCEIDHIDGDGLNNQKSNLRICTKQENSMNRSARISQQIQYKGVSWHSVAQKYIARIQYKGTRHLIGFFESPVDAAIAYNAKASELFGMFAYLNNVSQTDSTTV